MCCMKKEKKEIDLTSNYQFYCLLFIMRNFTVDTDERHPSLPIRVKSFVVLSLSL